MSDLTVTDARGRVIKLRELDPADMLDLIETAPQCDAMSAWLRYATVIHSVEKIDDLPIPRPTMKEHVRALAKRLGNDGYAAVALALYGADASPEADTNAKVASADESEAQAVKN